MAARLLSVISTGNLSELLILVNDQHEQAIDRQEYADAVARQNHHARMMAHFQALYAASHTVALSQGRRAAFVVDLEHVVARDGGIARRFVFVERPHA